MSGALSHRHLFGLKGDVKDNVAYVDDITLVYIAGHNTVVYNTLERRQRFIHGSEDSEGITAMAVCPSKRYGPPSALH